MGRQEHIQFHSTELPRPIKCSPSDQYTFPFSFGNRKQLWTDVSNGYYLFFDGVLFFFTLAPKEKGLTEDEKSDSHKHCFWSNFWVG